MIEKTDAGTTRCLECGRLENILVMLRCTICLRYRCPQCIHHEIIPAPGFSAFHSVALRYICENHMEIVRD